MKKRNANTLVISLALMLVMCVATTLLSFSLADDAPGDGGTGSGSSFNTTKTNIDYIIQNSKSTEKDETGRDLSPFYIVEIGSAANANKSPLNAMVAEDKLGDSNNDDISQFVKQVINGWSTLNETMAPNKISYQYISVPAILGKDDPEAKAKAIDDAVSAIGKADMVYLSNDPDAQYSSSKDIPEDIKLALSAAATATYTPFIIDSPTKTQNGGNGGGTSATTFTSLAQNVFAKAGYYRNTFSYNTSSSADVEKYLNRRDTKSLWLPINGANKSNNWYVDADGKTTARVLTIKSGDADTAITTLIKGAAGTTPYDLAALVAADPTFDPTGKEAFAMEDDTPLKYYGYLSTKVKPDNVIFESLDVTNLTGDTDLGVYDIVILEKGVSAKTMSADVKNMLSSMVYGMQHILYDSTMSSSQGGEDISDIVTSDAVNYQYVMNKVADANEVSRFTNVLVTGMAEMKIYGAATAPSGVKAIADIINNGSYRNSGGGGNSSNLYTVLEIQPCYPIDLELGKALKNRGMRQYAEKARKDEPENDSRDIFYYLKHDSVLNDVTSDEISYDGGVTSLSDMETVADDATTGVSARGAVNHADLITEDTAKDYYAWELSKAKVAKLTGLDYNKVKVVHMSTVEFNTSRETILDNYDAIYIGGKNTAIKEIKWIPVDGRNSNPAVYNMYFHNGGTYNNGSGIGVLTGNDITYDRFKELEKYIAVGMPVVFTKDVTEAYYDAKANTYRNNLMDPECNMFKLMDGCMDSTAAEQNTNGDYFYKTNKDNVLAGFDPTDQIKVLNDGTLGTTYSGYVTVFGGVEKEAYIMQADGRHIPQAITPSTTNVNAAELSTLLTTSRERPKFSLLQAPQSYIEGDLSTEITGSSITFNVDVAAKGTYTVNIYADDNTNSRFEDGEVIYTKKNVSGKITANFASSFDGGLYWKFEIVSGENKSSVTGLCKIHVKTPNYVNVLQIAPESAKTSVINGKTTLLFCTECQEARGILHGNRYTNVGKYTEASAYNGPTFYDANFDVGGTLLNPATYDPGFTNPAQGKSLGLHRHNFGIVKYDSNYTLGGYTGLDNWETNWAEDVYNDYDIDMDIWTTREYEANVKDAMTKVTKANAADVLENYKTLASIYKNYYMTLKQVISGKADTASANYTYLKNKLTKTNTTFVEADINQFFGEEKAAYDLETAKGGFHVPEAEFDMWSQAQGNLDTLLMANHDGTQSSDKATTDQMYQEITYELKYHRYSDFFSMFNASTQLKKFSNNFYNQFVTNFQYWRNAKIYEEYFYRMYMKYLTYSTMKEYEDAYYPDFTEVYSCIVIGVAEDFDDDDIKTQEAINALKMYIENEGNTFIFHETINDDGGTKMMTNNLKTLFGQNYNHITSRTVKETALSYQVKMANSWEEGSAAVICEGTLEEGQGLNVNITESGDGEIVPEGATATANGTGRINVSWTKTGGGNWSNKRVWIYINGSNTAKYTFNPAEHNSASGTVNNAATITEHAVETTRVINESPTDTNRYHYTPLLNNGKSIAVSTKHLTMVNPGVWGNAEKFSRFMYRQTAILNSDINIPNYNINFISDIAKYGAFTNRATQTNKGVVTMYPFMIGSELKISETHPNSFSTDIENQDLVVYYALAGGGKGAYSSVVAADPQDGIDNYFLYSLGNVTYCGAGHSLLTGRKRDNNDERRLFINIILNSAKKSVFGPTIDVFDPYPEKNPDGTVKTDEDGNPIYTNNDIIRAEDGTYEMVVPTTESEPEFTYRVTVPDTADEVSHVMIYYDLSPNASSGDYGFVNNTDVKIFEADAKDDTSILKNKYKLISSAIDALKLKPEYFRPYDNKYTYIVIAVKTKKGTITMQRIMVKIAPKLWDMT